MDNKMIIYQTEDNKVKIEVNIKDETVWLSAENIAELFQRDRTVIQRHIRNTYQEGELTKNSTCANFAQVQKEGDRTINRYIPYYNLDMIISVGYRVKSKQGTIFRIWANQILKQYILQGYVVNQERIEQLNIAVQIMKRTYNNLDSKQVLDVVEAYTTALNLLDDYDHGTIEKGNGTKDIYRLNYNECLTLVKNLKNKNKSQLFGNEKDESFQSSIEAIYQTFNGADVYPSLQEKAANLIYFVIKNHSFSDGNKRIAATIFLYFLDKNNVLFKYGNKVIEDHTLVALVIMIAESNPQEKDAIIKLVMAFL